MTLGAGQVNLAAAATTALHMSINTTNVKTVRLVSNTGSDWLTLATFPLTVTADGDHVDAFAMTTTANTASAARTAVVTLEYGNSVQSAQASFTVVQAGVGDPSLIVLPSYTIAWEGRTGANTLKIPVTYDGTLEVSEAVDWLSVGTVPNSGENLEVTVNQNDNYTREGYITFTVTKGGKTTRQSVLIRQTAKGAPQITMATTTNFVAAAGATTTFAIGTKTNTNSGSFVLNGVAYSPEASGWLSDITVSNSAVTAKVAANTAAANRYADISFNYGNDLYNEVQVVRVYQYGVGAPTLSIGNPLYFSSAVHTNEDFAFTTNAADADVTVSAAEATAWATVTKNGSNARVTLTANTTGSNRVTYFTISATKGGVTSKQTVQIYQFAGAPSMTIDNSTMYIAQTGGNTSRSFTIENVTAVTVVSKPDFVTVTVPTLTGGSGTYNLGLVFSSNSSAGVDDARSGNITLAYGDGTATRTVSFTVYQYGD